MNIKEIVTVLKKTDAFGKLPDTILHTLSFSAEKINYSTGDLLLKSSDREPKCLVVLEGRAFIQKKSGPIELKVAAVIGLLSLINDTKPKDSIIAGSTGVALIINKVFFDQMTSEFPEFTVGIKDEITTNINSQIDKLQQFTS